MKTQSGSVLRRNRRHLRPAGTEVIMTEPMNEPATVESGEHSTEELIMFHSLAGHPTTQRPTLHEIVLPVHGPPVPIRTREHTGPGVDVRLSDSLV